MDNASLILETLDQHLEELREAFERAKPRVRELARKAAMG